MGIGDSLKCGATAAETKFDKEIPYNKSQALYQSDRISTRLPIPPFNCTTFCTGCKKLCKAIIFVFVNGITRKRRLMDEEHGMQMDKTGLKG